MRRRTGTVFSAGRGCSGSSLRIPSLHTCKQTAVTEHKAHVNHSAPKNYIQFNLFSQTKKNKNCGSELVNLDELNENKREDMRRSLFEFTLWDNKISVI